MIIGVDQEVIISHPRVYPSTGHPFLYPLGELAPFGLGQAQDLRHDVGKAGITAIVRLDVKPERRPRPATRAAPLRLQPGGGRRQGSRASFARNRAALPPRHGSLPPGPGPYQPPPTRLGLQNDDDSWVTDFEICAYCNVTYIALPRNSLARNCSRHVQNRMRI